MKKMILLFAMISTQIFAQNDLKNGLYAQFKTDKGTITAELFYDKTPLTVANFVALAEGNHPEVDALYRNKRFFDGLKFHRVIADFMIQGGDPKGDGSGQPGYLFPDEIVEDLRHSGPGILSMANRGPSTNGSQFFITHKATPNLDGRHTVFGQVIIGQDVVDAIAQNDIIEKVEIIRVGKTAKNFNAAKKFSTLLQDVKKEQELKEQKIEAIQRANKSMLDSFKNQATSLASGVQVFVANQGNGEKPIENETIYFDYAGYLSTGKMFDSGIERLAIENEILDPQRKATDAYKPLEYTIGGPSYLIKGIEEGLLTLKKGDKAYIFIPSELGYGQRGAGNVVPPNSDLVFYVEILNNN